MPRYAIGAVVLAALALSGTSSLAQSTPSTDPTAAPSATTVDVTGVLHSVVYSEDRGFPKPGTSQVALSVGKNTGGPTPTTSVGIGRTTITGHPSPNTWTYKATEEDYTYGVGALRTALTGRFTIKGKFMVDKAQGHVTEGTGSFTGVTGTFTSTGRNRVGARVFTYISHGTYTLP